MSFAKFIVLGIAIAVACLFVTVWDAIVDGWRYLTGREAL